MVKSSYGTGARSSKLISEKPEKSCEDQKKEKKRKSGRALNERCGTRIMQWLKLLNGDEK